jgi:hypothetical protein
MALDQVYYVEELGPLKVGISSQSCTYTLRYLFLHLRAKSGSVIVFLEAIRCSKNRLIILLTIIDKLRFWRYVFFLSFMVRTVEKSMIEIVKSYDAIG